MMRETAALGWTGAAVLFFGHLRLMKILTLRTRRTAEGAERILIMRLFSVAGGCSIHRGPGSASSANLCALRVKFRS
jgi:hypothetical protein